MRLQLPEQEEVDLDNYFIVFRFNKTNIPLQSNLMEYNLES